ncbi:Hypothetical predicted protein [Paramuricea clavata]|uniref:Uncharacterized protein n=1 Tax=Paramuricea clavata TaxID=317549 RepID=A0A6S7HGK3_PARCT|nr:Hypothetical predicted protein [Paramuricea clavata]
MYYIISYESHTNNFVMEGYFTIFCPIGYWMNLNCHCIKQSRNLTVCNLFLASCEQCRPNTYSLDRGKVHHNITNKITCQKCPASGDCSEGKVTSKKNFWGYESNQRVKFLQCPPKYCCDIDHCKHYNTCHGHRMGTLCGECPSGMSESLFSTKCKPNKNCTSGIFWPGVSAYLILYLLFFLYQENIFNFVHTRVISRIFLPSRNGRYTKPGGLIKIIFYYYQVVHLLRNSVGSDEKARLLDDMESFLSRAFNFLIVSIPAFDCPFQELRPVQKAMIIHSVGYSLLVLLCLLYFSTFVLKKLQKLRTRSSQQTFAHTETTEHTPNLVKNPFVDRISGAFASISLLMYNSSTQLCLSLLYCVPVAGNSHVLFIDGHIKCYQTFQKFLFGYMILSILPFCLVPVLGSYLLKLNRISVAQFCLACIFPLPFCFYWSYLLVRNSSWCIRRLCRVRTNENVAAIGEDDRIQDNNSSTENFIDSNTFEDSEIVSGNLRSEPEPSCNDSAVLRVLLGPFRAHRATFIFPSSHLPWECFLIFRRLALILVLTFVFDNHMKATVSTMLCVAILLTHVFVKPFKTASDNILETLSLGTLIIISLFSLVKGIHNGEDLDSGSLLDMINVTENILIVSPVLLIISLVTLCILSKLVLMFRFCFQALFRRCITDEIDSLLHRVDQEEVR